MPDREAPGEEEFILRPLDLRDSFRSMQSGSVEFSPLKSFVQTRAKRYEVANLARTYVVEDVHEGRLAAYITLVCSEVSSKEQLVHEDGVDFPYPHYPAVKIARLLVDVRYRGENSRGLGKQLVEFSLGLARTEVCPSVGCRFVVVDSKRDAVRFYEKCGFTLINTPDNRSGDRPVLFIDLHKAAIGTGD